MLARISSKMSHPISWVLTKLTIAKASMATTRPITAYMMEFLAVSTRFESPAEVINCMPPMIKKITASAPAANSKTLMILVTITAGLDGKPVISIDTAANLLIELVINYPDPVIAFTTTFIITPDNMATARPAIAIVMVFLARSIDVGLPADVMY